MLSMIASTVLRHLSSSPRGIVAAAVSAASIASAQNETGGLEEVTVTAQRREQSLQDVPIAITALSGDQLAAKGAGDQGHVVVDHAQIGSLIGAVRAHGVGVELSADDDLAAARRRAGPVNHATIHDKDVERLTCGGPGGGPRATLRR